MVEELLHALAVSPEDDDLDTGAILDRDILFSTTAGLIYTDYAGCIRLVHYTTHKYFEKNKERWFPHARVEIAMIILTYLNFESFAEPCQETMKTRNLMYVFCNIHFLSMLLNTGGNMPGSAMA